jgi:proteasome lid subunit RPN8/RPN11
VSEKHTVRVDRAAYEVILQHGEASYPNEGAGFLLGASDGEVTRVEVVLTVENRWDPATQATRYLLEPRDWMQAEDEADARSLAVVGIFHSHPDHPPRPSQFDLDMALPNLAYLITSVRGGKAEETLAWRLGRDRNGFIEENLETD